jgi:peptide/nickel transport system permease protein
MIADALPWTMGLLFVATALGFAAGALLGGIAAWPAGPRVVKWLVVPVMAVSAIPYYLMGLLLVYVFGLGLGLFPVSGGYSPGATPGLSFGFGLDVLHHSILPALSVVLASTGFWALGMRGMMVTTLGEDYVRYAEATGLRPKTVFLRFAMRNAILPQFTSLALSLGYVVSGSVLVEVVFSYPGVGTLLFRAISVSDYTLIHGIVFMIILAVGLVTLALDLAYPMLDPRVAQERSV